MVAFDLLYLNGYDLRGLPLTSQSFDPEKMNFGAGQWERLSKRMLDFDHTFC
jgi:hypothetical protein